MDRQPDRQMENWTPISHLAKAGTCDKNVLSKLCPTDNSRVKIKDLNDSQEPKSDWAFGKFNHFYF